MDDRTTLTPEERALSWRWRAALLLIVALSFGLRWLTIEQYEASHPLADRPVIDELSYDRWAREIAGGEWLGREVFFQEPLYPYVLGSIYACVDGDAQRERHAARLAHAAWGGLTVLLTGLLTRALFGRRAGLVAAALMALHRPHLWFSVLLLKENLFCAVLAALALLLVATRRAASARAETGAGLAVGVLAGAGALLRGNLLVLLPCLAIWPVARALWERRPLARACLALAAFGLGLALVLGPVAWRNHAVGGRWVLSTSGAGTNFYGGNNLDNPYGLAKEFDWVRGVPEHEADDWRHEAERRAGRELDATEVSDFWLAAALDSMRAQPLEHLWILWRKLRLTLGSYEVPDNHFLEWDARWVPLLAWPWPGFALSGTLALAGLALFLGLCRPWRSTVVQDRAAYELAVLIALYLGTIVLTVTSERARLVLVPLLVPFAAWLVVRAGELARRAPWTSALVLCASAAFVLVPTLPRALREADFDERDHQLAVVLLRSGGDLDEVERLSRELSARHPDTPRVVLLAVDLGLRRAAERARLEPAVSAEVAGEYERLLTELERIRPWSDSQETFRIDVLAGALFERLGGFAAAEESYRRARVFDPEDLDVLHRLARATANRAMAEPDAPARLAALERAERLLVETHDDPGPGLELLQAVQAEIEKLRAGGAQR